MRRMKMAMRRKMMRKMRKRMRRRGREDVPLWAQRDKRMKKG